ATQVFHLNRILMSDQSQPTEKQIQDGIEYARKKALLDQLQQKEKELPPVDLNNSSSNTNIIMKAFLIGFLALAFIAIGIWMCSPSTPAEVPSQVDARIAEYFIPIKHPASTLRSGGAEESVKDQAIRAYSEGDYATAMTNFEQVVKESDDALSTLFLGVSELATGDADAAIEHLETYAKEDPTGFGDELNYQLALAYHMKGDEVMAKNYAQSIEGEEMQERLVGVLGELAVDGIYYYRGKLSFGSQDTLPIRTAKITDIQGITSTVLIGDIKERDYFYFDDPAVIDTTIEYYFHIVEMPLPNSFKLVEYSPDATNRQVTATVDLGEVYKDQRVFFLTNIRSVKEVNKMKLVTYVNDEKQFYGITEDTRQGKSISWDYKRRDTLINGQIRILSCGTRCRELLVLDLVASGTSTTPPLLAFYTDEPKAGNNRVLNYYIPLMGHSSCNNSTPADIVFFNTTKEVLENHWITKHEQKRRDGKLPGVADIVTLPYATESFGEGDNSITIKVETDIDSIRIRVPCEPVSQQCQ
ncbi:MAG: tetratricopeptide repeat protein, partial [Bacteroidota bacterium]